MKVRGLAKLVWSGKVHAVEMARRLYLKDEIAIVKWMSINYSFRIQPICKARLKWWYDHGWYIRLLEGADKNAPDYYDTVDVLTRILLWCGGWEKAMEYAGDASNECSSRRALAELQGVPFEVSHHTCEHLYTTYLLARARGGAFREVRERWAEDIAEHLDALDSAAISDSNQRVRVLAGYARVAAIYGMLWRAIKLGWQAVCVRGVPRFVQGKAQLTLFALPFIWLRNL